MVSEAHRRKTFTETVLPGFSVCQQEKTPQTLPLDVRWQPEGAAYHLKALHLGFADGSVFVLVELCIYIYIYCKEMALIENGRAASPSQ